MVMGQGINPMNSPRGRTTRLSRPMVRTKVGGCFNSERTSQRRRVKKVERPAMVLGKDEVRWPCEAYFGTRISPA